MEYPDNTPWCEKYRASCFSDVKGQEVAIDNIKKFLKDFPKKRGIILHGNPGTGKTSLAYVIAFEMNAEILELNASDLRNKDKIANIIGPALKQQHLFKKQKIILIDEVDGISGWYDRGGLSELISLIDESPYPIIITANDIWDSKFVKLRQKATLVQLKDINYKIIFELLLKICERERRDISKDVLTSISIKSRGDIRAALNDLQLAVKAGIVNTSEQIDEREKNESIFSALQYVFKNANIDKRMLDIFDKVDMNIDDIFLWIEENIPLEYKGEELFNAFEALSKADVFRGRIYRHQHWRFLVYEYFLLGAGIASSKKSNRAGWTNYKKPSRILKIWMQKQRNLKKKSICIKYAHKCHISIKQAMKDFLLLRVLLKNHSVRKELGLDEEEIAYLDK
jgi:replication factor C large subunit